MRILAAVFSVLILGTMGVSLFYMTVDMDMGHGMNDCPFMTHSEMVCPMDLADHIAAWKEAFLAVTPTLILLLGVATAITLLISTTPHVLLHQSGQTLTLYRQLRERTYAYSYRPWQELFSRGILNPKLF